MLVRSSGAEEISESSADIHYKNQTISEEQSLSQPMELLWSNILSNHSVKLFANDSENNYNANTCYQVNEESQSNHKEQMYFSDHLEDEDAFEPENGSEDNVTFMNYTDEQQNDQTKLSNEEFINSIIERIAVRNFLKPHIHFKNA